MSTKSKVKVYRATDRRWYWGHRCPQGGWASGPTVSKNLIDPPATDSGSWKEAYRHATKHAEECP